MKQLSSYLLMSLASVALACGGPAGEPPATADAMTGDVAAPASEAPPATANLLETANAAGSFTTLLAALKAADLEGTLSGPGPFTVFAPTDEAFAKLPAGTVDGLLKPENKEKLVAVLTYHVISGNMMAKDVVGAKSLKTVQGQEVSVSQQGSDVLIDGAKVLKTDIAASNGVIHVIDSVVLPK